jgi:hypothetical protein
MNCIQGAQGWLGDGACVEQCVPFHWQQPNRVQDFPGLVQELSERQSRVVGHSSPDSARHLGQDQFARDQIIILEEGAKRLALGLLLDQLDDG